MHDAEARALRRAVTVLVLVSSARWAWAQAAPSGAHVSGDAPDVGDELLAESRVAVREAEARSRPLEPGELIDPNRAGEVELDRLPGVGPATARAIVAAREEGARFRRAEDLTVVRGLGPVSVERLRPLLDFTRPPPSGAAAGRSTAGRAPPSRTVDVNRASAEELTALPGIGPALAERIVAERRKRMFTSVDDLGRVSGIGPATVDRLRGHAHVSGGF